MKRAPQSTRVGNLTSELLVALAVMAVVIGLVAHGSIQIRRLERQHAASLRAILAAENALELLQTVDWEELNTRNAASILAARSAAWNVDRIGVEVVSQDGTPSSKRIDIWVPASSGALEADVRLSTWRFKQ